jgi:hypothetical protein
MKLSTIKRLLLEGLPSDVKKWIPGIVQPLNQFLDQVTRALANELTVSDNLKAQQWSVTIGANQTYPIRLAYRLNERPSAVFVGKIAASAGAAVPAHSFEWTWKGESLEVRFNSLSAEEYNVTLIALV